MEYSTIHKLSGAIRSGTISPVDVIETSLSRIEDLNPALNAFITILADEARASAQVAEAEIRSGNWRGPLHGVPVAVKDFYDIAGVRTTAGSEEFADNTATTDAEVVQMFRRAGAIIVGKTNMDSLGMATTGLTSHFGPVKNPWNAEFITGGSSAGSAVAVAAGMCFATVDTDAVGSVRLPASCCGVFGFKGSYDLISIKGILGDGPVDDFIRWMGHAGITSRSAGDTALVLNALSNGSGPQCSGGIELPDLSIRVGIGDNVDAVSDVAQAMQTTAAILRSINYKTISAPVPFGDPGNDGFAAIEKNREKIGIEGFQNVDIFVLPTFSSQVPTVDEAEINPSQGLSAEQTAFANYYGLPAISVPCGFDSNGMPVGLQFVTRPGGDATLLKLAYHLEQSAEFAMRHPPNWWTH